MKRLKYNTVYRFTVIVWMVIKFICKIYVFHFRAVIWDRESKRKWNLLLEKVAKEYRMKAERLGGLLIKVGQFLSTRPDFMPNTVIEELAQLVDNVPPMPYNYAKSLLEKEWGTEVETYLKAIKKESIASASIGEVYRGMLHDGTVVAIKVRHHRIDEIIHKDFVTFRIVFWLLNILTSLGKKTNLKELYKELVTVIDRELDFRQELEFAKAFKERYRDNHSIHIPFYYDHLCTDKVLVMEWVEGAKITDVAFMRKYQIDVEKTSRIVLDFYIDQFLNEGLFHADPHAGNIIIKKDGRVGIIDFGMIGEINKEDIQHFKLVVQGFIIENYDMVMDALCKMNFVLPKADKQKLKRAIKDVVDKYSDGSLKDFDGNALERINEEIDVILKEDAIQLPADYAYLLRAISIISGIIFQINPTINIVKWAKPKIRDWFGTRSIIESVTKQYVKNATEPFLAYPRAILNWLEGGEKDRQWDREKQIIYLRHQYYLLLEFTSFMMIIIGIAIMVSSVMMQVDILKYIGIIILSLFTIMFSILLWFHFLFIRRNDKRRLSNE